MARVCPRELAELREDLVQDAALRVIDLEKRGAQEQVRTASYLWRVAFAATMDELRKLRRRLALAQGQEALAALPVAADSGAAGLESKGELALAIQRCLEQLPEPRRAAVVLHLQGFRVEEASGILGWNVKKVENLTYRGLAELRKALEAEGHAP